MPHYHVRAEFRRLDRTSRWVLAGVTVDGAFWPAVEGVEPVRARLPGPGLVGWQDVPTPVVAPDAASAATIGLQVVRAHWPDRVRRHVPYASGTRDEA